MTSSTRIARALIQTEPANIDAGEITDKGYINQRQVLSRRATDVARLFSGDPDVLSQVTGTGTGTSTRES